MPTPPEQTEIRPEIQGLRAIAVSLVLVFHIWPTLIPGGYVGVDVFLVISGYLITGGLLREAEGDGRISVRAFYVRRLRRILPAATFVLLVVAVMIPALPATRWKEAGIEIQASAVYVENWILAARSIDYFAKVAPPSPVQHYWSLSIEGQFYLLWPFLFLAIIAAARRFGFGQRSVLAGALGLACAASLVASIFLTAHDPRSAYFLSQSRLWEFGLGGLLALLEGTTVPGRRAIASPASAIGLAAILTAAFVFSSSTPFPGASALVPTLGAALVIFASATRGVLPGSLLDLAPLRFLGDRSYSVYLWHWPIIVIYGAVSGREPVWFEGIAIAAVVIAVSHLSYRFIEQRFRRPTPSAKARSAAILAGVAVAACLAAPIAILRLLDRPITTSSFELDYPGPAVLTHGTLAAGDVPFVPTLIDVKEDFPETRALGCDQTSKESQPESCLFGDPAGPVQIALVGDSHAAQWAPALIRIVEERGWGLRTFTKGSCPFARVTVLLDGRPYDNCVTWRQRVLKAIRRTSPDIVITTQSCYYTLAEGSAGAGSMKEGLLEVWRHLQRRGGAVIAIRDTARFPFDPTECLAQGRSDCAVKRADAFSVRDPIVETARLAGARAVDMSDAICGPEWCEPVVGNVLAWRDSNHLTATYSRMLATELAMRAGLQSSGPPPPGSTSAP